MALKKARYSLLSVYVYSTLQGILFPFLLSLDL